MSSVRRERRRASQLRYCGVGSDVCDSQRPSRTPRTKWSAQSSAAEGQPQATAPLKASRRRSRPRLRPLSTRARAETDGELVASRCRYRAGRERMNRRMLIASDSHLSRRARFAAWRDKSFRASRSMPHSLPLVLALCGPSARGVSAMRLVRNGAAARACASVHSLSQLARTSRVA